VAGTAHRRLPGFAVPPRGTASSVGRRLDSPVKAGLSAEASALGAVGGRYVGIPTATSIPADLGSDDPPLLPLSKRQRMDVLEGRMASYDSKFENISSQLESVLAALSAGGKAPVPLPIAEPTTSQEVSFSAEPPMEVEYEEDEEVASTSSVAQHSVAVSAPSDQAVRWQEAVLCTQTLCEYEFPQGLELSPERSFRVKDPSAQDVAQSTPLRLPFHQDFSDTMEACRREVITPSGKSKKELGALKAGQFLLPEKEIAARFYKPLGNSHLIFPSKLNPDFYLLSDGSLLNHQAVIKADQAFQIEEKAARELLMVQSAAKWTRQAMNKLAAVAPDPEGLADTFAKLSVQEDVFTGIMLDRVTTTLTNIILRRRDLWLRAIKGSLPHEHLEALRTAPLLHPKLFGDVPSLILDKVRDQRRQDHIVSALARGLKGPPSSQPSSGHPKPSKGGKGKSKDGSAGKRSFPAPSPAAPPAGRGRGEGSTRPKSPASAPRGRGTAPRGGRGRGGPF